MILVRIKNYFNFSNYSIQPKHYDDSNKSVVVKIKNGNGGVPFEEFVELNLRMYSFLVDDCSEHKKVKGANKNAVYKISRDVYKNVLFYTFQFLAFRFDYNLLNMRQKSFQFIIQSAQLLSQAKRWQIIVADIKRAKSVNANAVATISYDE